ncbi:Uncharacterised protein [uncultured archaeon]|nr:Uncharacterised protein [uncultured archaeon]
MSSDIKFEVLKKNSSVNFKLNELGKVSKIDGVSPPSVFIGSKLKYPEMNVGILSPLQREEEAWIYDDAKFWAKNNLAIEEVIALRGGLLNSRFKGHALSPRLTDRFTLIAQEIAIASKPVDVEIELKNKIDLDKKPDRVLTQHGFSAGLKSAKVVSNVKVNQKVDKVINDEIKASEGIKFLYKNNFDEYTLSKILSVGVLGLKKNKKFVPTRWSITATDDSIGKDILERVRQYKWIENHELFYGEFLGNQYLLLLFPGVFSYELFELYVPGSSWNPSTEMKASTDYEDFYGRKEYAFNCAGGYYASRLPILEYLDSIKRQASVLVIRIETPSYWAALGVWVVRESVRKALQKRMTFASREELLDGAKQISKIKYKYDNSGILAKSKLLSQIKTQKKLGEFGI